MKALPSYENLEITHQRHDVTFQNIRRLITVAVRSSNLVKIKVFYIVDSLTFEDLTKGSVTNYKPAQQNIPEEPVCQLQRVEHQNSVVFYLSRGLPTYRKNLHPVYLTFKKRASYV
jgi:hypothetical protein